MRKEEAAILVMMKYPNHTIGKVTETDNYFLISVSPKVKNTSGVIRPVVCDDGLKAVDKKTREVFTYNPILHGLRK